MNLFFITLFFTSIVYSTCHCVTTYERPLFTPQMTNRALQNYTQSIGTFLINNQQLEKHRPIANTQTNAMHVDLPKQHDKPTHTPKTRRPAQKRNFRGDPIQP